MNALRSRGFDANAVSAGSQGLTIADIATPEDIQNSTPDKIIDAPGLNLFFTTRGLFSRRLGSKMANMDVNSSVSGQINILAFGDSLGDLMPIWLRTESRANGFLTGVGGDDATVLSYTTGAARVTAQFSLWPTGVVSQLTATGGTIIAQGEYGSVRSDTIRIFYAQQLGAGTFKVYTSNRGEGWIVENGGVAYNANNPTTDCGIITLTKSLGDYRVKIEWDSGTTNILLVDFNDSDKKGVHFIGMNEDGLPLNSSVLTNTTLFNTAIAALAPDLAFFNMFDEGANFTANLTTNQNRFDTAYADTTWVYSSTTPKSTAPNNAIAQSERTELREFAILVDQFFFDQYVAIGEYANLVRLNWQGDGTHNSSSCFNYLYRTFGSVSGWDSKVKKLLVNDELSRYRDRSITSSFAETANNTRITTATSSQLVIGTGEFTVGGWVWFDRFASDQFIFSGASGAFALRVTGGGNLYVSKFGTSDATPASMAAPLGRWTFLTSTRIGTTVTYYYDGIPVTGVISSLDFTSQILYIGSQNTATHTAIKVREPFVANVGLTPGEVRDLYESNWNPRYIGGNVSSVTSGNLVSGKVYLVRSSTPTDTVTTGGVTYGVGEKFVASSTTFTTSGSPTVTRVGVITRWTDFNGATWQDDGGQQINATVNNGSTIWQPSMGVLKRVSTQFDKTDTTLANVTGLSFDVLSTGIYDFEAVLHATNDVAGGHKYSIGGTATATSVIFQVQSIDNTSDLISIADRQTSLGASSAQVGTITAYTLIKGSIVVNAAGTLTVQFAQSVAAGTSSILVGSTFKLFSL